MEIRTVITDFEGLLIPYDVKEELAKDVLKTGKKPKAGLYAWGMLTYLALKRVKRNDEKGNDARADKWAKRAFNYYEHIIRGLDMDYIEEFGRRCAKDLDINACGAIGDLRERGYDVFLMSGCIREIVEEALKKAQIDKYFNAIYCNMIKKEDGKVIGLSKTVRTPKDKAMALHRLADAESTAAIGHDYWDRDLFREVALPICFTGGSWSPNSARKVAEQKGKLVKNLREVEGILKQAH